MIVHVPAHLPPGGARGLVIVLHGGLGNAQHIASGGAEGGLNMDAVADRGGFVVAYLNGTAVARVMGDRLLGWNAGGGCCGLAARNDIDDVGYITKAAEHLESEYGIDRTQVFAVGHSNGAMMAQRVVCEAGVFSAIVAISGPLNMDGPCPGARGRRILAIHGADDQNVPIAGGVGPRGLSRVDFRSEAASEQTQERAGATYTLQVVPGAAHMLDGLQGAITKSEGVTIAEKTARFFGLLKAQR